MLCYAVQARDARARARAAQNRRRWMSSVLPDADDEQEDHIA
jgi:hypothetical protein